ncbi:hypothetical protein [Mycobacterium sp.]|uniref:hypothetical protein n=1 Tax=Mycobacterium sp. TaxID=1785 RepID=UPI0031DD0DCF
MRCPQHPLLVELKATNKRQLSEHLKCGVDYTGLDYVVCNEAGQLHHPDTLSTMRANTVTAAGAPRIRPHDARH